jgi:crotonobetainyl-CoA:carnitine CoA-transferase CaiB-like acyl-CoA transferase
VGEHNAEVLAEAGFSAGEIAALAEKGVLVGHT